MYRYCRLFALIAAAELTVFACEQKVEQPARATATAAGPAPSSAKVEPAPPPSVANPAVPSPVPVNPLLLTPHTAKATAPARFKVKFSTTKGDFIVQVTRAWAPLGADRFYNLVKLGFYADIGFFRVVPDFVVQFGIHGNPEVAKAWKGAPIKDDKKAKQSNQKGTVTFAKSGPDTRTTQVFVNFKDNPKLDKMGFPPLGKVISGMEVVEAINKEYGEQPDQAMMLASGNSYLRDIFPRLDYVKSAELVK
jgi:peptidyl-prolyl cis-trans isomerase A (cyclophilin A)